MQPCSVGGFDAAHVLLTVWFFSPLPVFASRMRCWLALEDCVVWRQGAVEEVLTQDGQCRALRSAADRL